MNRQLIGKLLVAVLAGIAFVTGVVLFGDTLSLDYLASQEESLRSYQQEHLVLSYALAFLIYVTITGLSIPGATVLTLLYGWFFGLVRGVLLLSFASTAGATVAFLLSRYLLKDAIQSKFGDRLQQFNHALEKDGPFYLFTLRLIPAVPFFVINAVMGLTPINVSTFWWVSQLGMLPATIVYAYAGSSAPTLAELAEQGTSGILNIRIIVALVLLGLFPLAVKALMSKFAAKAPGEISDV